MPSAVGERRNRVRGEDGVHGRRRVEAHALQRPPPPVGSYTLGLRDKCGGHVNPHVGTSTP